MEDQFLIQNPKPKHLGRVRPYRARTESKANILYRKLYDLEFMHKPSDYTTDELKKLIQVVFKKHIIKPQYKIAIPTIAAQFEKLSCKIMKGPPKMCDFKFLEVAFKQCNIEIDGDILDNYPKISIADYNFLNNLLKKI